MKQNTLNDDKMTTTDAIEMSTLAVRTVHIFANLFAGHSKKISLI